MSTFAVARNRRTRAAALAALAVLGMVVTAVTIVRFVGAAAEWYFTPPRQRPFDRDLWLRSRPWTKQNGHDNTCWSMTDDLQKRYLRPGMTRPQVERLLGRPDRVRRADFFRYTVGDDGPSDPALLTIFFDRLGRLILARTEW